MNLNEIMEKYTKEQIEEIKNNALEMETYGGERLEEVVLKLENFRRNGQINYFANFNDYKLYSIDVTMNKAYKEVIGCTKRTWDRRMKKMFERNRQAIEENKRIALEQLPIVIEKGKKYIHLEKINQWIELCKADAEGTYCGLLTKDALIVMQALEESKPYEEIREIINLQNHSGYSYSFLMRILLLFANDGPNFYRYMQKGHIDKFNIKYASKIRKLNKLLVSGKSYKEAKELLKDHKIYDISISYDPNNIGNFTVYEDISKGTILVNIDGSFEGIIDNYYSYGTVFEDGSISFATFPGDNYTMPNHFCGVRVGNDIIGRYEQYLTLLCHNNDTFDYGGVSIKLIDSKKEFTDELDLEKEIQEAKKKFTKLARDKYYWYRENEYLEARRTMHNIELLLKEKNESKKKQLKKD